MFHSLYVYSHDVNIIMFIFVDKNISATLCVKRTWFVKILALGYNIKLSVCSCLKRADSTNARQQNKKKGFKGKPVIIPKSPTMNTCNFTLRKNPPRRYMKYCKQRDSFVLL